MWAVDGLVAVDAAAAEGMIRFEAVVVTLIVCFVVAGLVAIAVVVGLVAVVVGLVEVDLAGIVEGLVVRVVGLVTVVVGLVAVVVGLVVILKGLIATVVDLVAVAVGLVAVVVGLVAVVVGLVAGLAVSPATFPFCPITTIPCFGGCALPHTMGLTTATAIGSSSEPLDSTNLLCTAHRELFLFSSKCARDPPIDLFGV